MPKINQEEYEVLKGLAGKWKWIARDELRNNVYVFYKKPNKYSTYWEDEDMIYEQIDENLFQFIKWEDEEPHNIAELIEEYERYEIENIHVERKHPMFNCNRFNGFYNANIAIWDRLEESEEKEVKDLEWAIKEIESLETEESQNYPHDEMVEKERVLGILKQLEVETLSPEFIDKHSWAMNKFGVNTYAVPVGDLQNLLVPKQEELTDEQIARKVDREYKDGYEKGKEHATEKQSEETETVASVLVDYLIASAKLKLALSMEVEELEE